jgi:hypothetical protein
VDPADPGADLADPGLVDALVGIAALGARIQPHLPAAAGPAAPADARPPADPGFALPELLR